jgi:hypothetical protein
MLAHTIHAIDKDKIKRVHCNTCMSQHVYRANPPGTRAPRKKKAATARKSAASKGLRASDYDKYMEGRDASAARRYSPKSSFGVGEVLEHPKFGTGVATQMKGQTKIEVLFPDGPRTLIHGL